MYNQLIYETILSKYGVEKTIDFCKMTSEANQHMYDFLNSDKGTIYETCMDYGYDANWWKEKGETLLKERNEKVLSVYSGSNIY